MPDDEANLDAEFAEPENDPDEWAEAERMLAEFAAAVAEAWAVIDEEDGPYPCTDAEPNELREIMSPGNL